MTALDIKDSDIGKDPEKYYFEICEDKAGLHRWRLKSDNGNIIADSGQGYKSLESCKNGIKIIKTVNNYTDERTLDKC